MKVAFFSTRPFDRRFFEAANQKYGHDLHYFESRLTAETSGLAAGFPAVCAFVQDQLDATVLKDLAEGGSQLIALRSAGFNNVGMNAAAEHDLTVVRVPAYSPHAVAEYAVGLMLALNRKVHRALDRVREHNFELQGLIGFDMHGRTAGIVGTGKIGTVVARILRGFGCKLLTFDVKENEECKELGVEYVALDDLLGRSDIITLHAPLNPKTHHFVNADAVARMKPDVMLINTSRGAVVDTAAVIEGLKSHQIGSLGLDVYEEEGDVFYRDLSDEVLEDDQLARLLTCVNVIVTIHQAFFTEDALEEIADTTLANIQDVEQGRGCPNALKADQMTKCSEFNFDGAEASIAAPAAQRA